MVLNPYSYNDSELEALPPPDLTVVATDPPAPLPEHLLEADPVVPEISIRDDLIAGDVVIEYPDVGPDAGETPELEEAYNPHQPRNPAGSSKGGQFASGGGAGAAQGDVRSGSPSWGWSQEAIGQHPPAVQAQIRKVEQELHDIHTEAERLVGIHPTTGEILFDSGVVQGAGMDVTPAMDAKLAGSIMIHNHPLGYLEHTFGDPKTDPLTNGNSFSSEDVLTGARLGAAEMRAVGPRATYVLRGKADPAWGFEYKDRASANIAQLDVANALSNAHTSTYLRGYQAIESGSLTRQQASARHWDTLWSELAPQRGWEYQAFKAPDFIEAYNANQPRDRTGKWASGGSAGTQVAVRSLERSGGYSVRTYGTATKRPPSTGVMMGYGADRGHNQRLTHAEHMSHADRVSAIREHYKANRTFIQAHPDRFAGGWMQTHPDGSATLHLDVSRYFPPSQRASAIRFGKSENQIAGYDLGSGEDIAVGGTGS